VAAPHEEDSLAMIGSDAFSKLFSRREFAMVAAFFAGNALPPSAYGRRNSALLSDAGVSADPTQRASSTDPVNNAVYNVKEYGAVGDGSANDAAAIQSAIKAAQATVSGGRIYFPPGIYFTGTTTISITSVGIVLEMADSGSYIKYAGTGYAISFGLAAAGHIHSCGLILVSVVCTNSAGSAVYAKSPYGFFIDHGYFENGKTGTTGTGVTIDSGLTSRKTGYFATHNVINHIRCNGFLKGILFKGGSLAGSDITTASTVQECFVNGLVGLAGTVGVEFQASQQCIVRGGNLESLSYGVKLVSTPSRCIGITIDTVRFEAIAVNNWLIPADSQNCVIISPRWNEDNGSNLAPDTVIVQNTQSRLNSVSLNKKAVICVNGNNNHTLDRRAASFIRITGPTAAFAIGGFSLDAGGHKGTDGTELTVYNATPFPMTINAGDSSAAANCGIRTPSGSNLVLAAGSGGSSARFIYDAAFPQWILVSHTG
jgi:hypothetical protein